MPPDEPWWMGGEVTRDADDVAYDAEYAEYLAAHPGYSVERHGGAEPEPSEEDETRMRGADQATRDEDRLSRPLEAS